MPGDKESGLQPGEENADDHQECIKENIIFHLFSSLHSKPKHITKNAIKCKINAILLSFLPLRSFFPTESRVYSLQFLTSFRNEGPAGRLKGQIRNQPGPEKVFIFSH